MYSILVMSFFTIVSAWEIRSRYYRKVDDMQLEELENIPQSTEPCQSTCLANDMCVGFTGTEGNCHFYSSIVNLGQTPTTIWHQAGQSCEMIHSDGEVNDEYYILDVGTRGVKVFCNFTHKPVETIIEHNYPQRTDVNGASNCVYPGDGKMYYITYGESSTDQLLQLMEGKSCRQFLKYDCHGSVTYYGGTMHTAWIDRNGNKMEYWAGGPPNGLGCACSLDHSCEGGSSRLCNCELNDLVWRSDEGYITDNTRLPVSALRICDTNDASEQGFITLGPLVCVQG